MRARPGIKVIPQSRLQAQQYNAIDRVSFGRTRVRVRAYMYMYVRVCVGVCVSVGVPGCLHRPLIKFLRPSSFVRPISNGPDVYNGIVLCRRTTLVVVQLKFSDGNCRYHNGPVRTRINPHLFFSSQSPSRGVGIRFRIAAPPINPYLSFAFVSICISFKLHLQQHVSKEMYTLNTAPIGRGRVPDDPGRIFAFERDTGPCVARCELSNSWP